MRETCRACSKPLEGDIDKCSSAQRDDSMLLPLFVLELLCCIVNKGNKPSVRRTNLID